MPDPDTTQALNVFADSIGQKIERAIDKGESNTLRLETKMDATALRQTEHITAIGVKLEGVAVELSSHRQEDNNRFGLIWKIILGGGTAGGVGVVAMKVLGG